MVFPVCFGKALARTAGLSGVTGWTQEGGGGSTRVSSVLPVMLWCRKAQSRGEAAGIIRSHVSSGFVSLCVAPSCSDRGWEPALYVCPGSRQDSDG